MALEFPFKSNIILYLFDIINLVIKIYNLHMAHFMNYKW